MAREAVAQHRDERSDKMRRGVFMMSRGITTSDPWACSLTKLALIACAVGALAWATSKAVAQTANDQTAIAQTTSTQTVDPAALTDEASRTQDNIIIVLDASGSMNEKMKGERRLDVAKRSLLAVLQQVPPTTNVGILVFSGAGKTGAWWLAPLGALDLPRVQRELASLQPNGGTPLGESMRVAADTLLEQRGKQLGYGTFRVLMLTDGEASDQQLVEKHLPLMLQRGLRLDVIGMDMKQGHSLATRVNSYRAAGSGQELTGAINEVFAEVASTGKDATDPELYGLVSSLSSEGALGVIGALKPSGNEPLLSVPLASKGDNAGGGLAASPGRSVTLPQPSSGGGSSSSASVSSIIKSTGIGALVCVGVGIVVLWGLASMARAAGRKKANELNAKAGRKGRPGW